MLSNLNISHNVTFNIGGNAYEVASSDSDSDSDSGEYDEEDKTNYYTEEQQDEEEEEELTPEERNMIINAISSFQYDTNGKDEENCAVCL